MRAFQIIVAGQPPALTDLPRPAPGPGELRVAIAACGLNFADLLMIEGKYQDTPAAPFTLGMELAGTVEALGPGVTGPAPGTRVAVFAGQGGLAEAGVFPAERCIPLPENVSFETAAALQIAHGTSHVALGYRAGLKPGETLVVLGAAGGVGLAAVEIGHLMGARVVAVARGADKLAVTQAAGADHLIDADTPDLRAALKGLGGADVVYDAVGGTLGEAGLAALRPGGRFLVVGFASGAQPQVKLNHLLVKNLTVHGLYWGGYLKLAPAVLADSLAQVFAWAAAGAIRPHVSHSLPLDRSAEALELLRGRKATGKVVVTMT
ncbi:zinc-binding dehydrogenase [Rhodobacter veldkampii DSM 11550]|uniref:Zinc-binding dehydrogenase n=1 Tax=Phaeovulum veldkampii DSM 11550 TaxID=1185920 RepID=A0A2T4JHA7_9RHOB|nr:NADPH:quinone oxidoreductase family protein [Phaeovulum veldkampii]MBK5945893.1 zinc-binding dehydrogenase [Phaeovulum veldkampii DSM 11550]PTE17291.1 zinc-binding dehydrogenase [Phaeovulum veldkampii DSM 11550]TDQ56368.1 NADPH2:quinone reductase [Phaeovulum veldkampii DSM 11550]